jgi:hypothetical protein
VTGSALPFNVSSPTASNSTESADVAGDEGLAPRRVGVEVDQRFARRDADPCRQRLVADNQFGERVLDEQGGADRP